MINRRQILSAGMMSIAATALPLSAFATEEDVQKALRDMFGNGKINEGRVTLNLPPIAENGYTVPLSVSVDSPMSESNYVKRIGIFAPRNPIPVLAQFHLTPRSGVADVATRIRMAGTQKILAVAEMNDGSLWSGSDETVVTLAACVVL